MQDGTKTRDSEEVKSEDIPRETISKIVAKAIRKNPIVFKRLAEI